VTLSVFFFFFFFGGGGGERGFFFVFFWANGMVCMYMWIWKWKWKFGSAWVRCGSACLRGVNGGFLDMCIYMTIWVDMFQKLM